MSKLLQNKYIRWLGIPALLLGLWFILTFLYIDSFDSSILILPYNHNKNNFSVYHKILYKGDELVGSFVGKANNLGIISFRFEPHPQINYNDEDILLFRIKEKGSKKWYYQEHYRSGLIYSVPFFPFGFPIISDSKGKTYEFELISLKGNKENAVSLQNIFPMLVSKYKVYKTDLVSNKKGIINFIYTKFINGMENVDVFYSSLVYLLPFVFYILSITPFGERLKEKLSRKMHALQKLETVSVMGYEIPVFKWLNSFVTITLLVMVLIDVFILQVVNDMLYVVIGLLWYYLVIRIQKVTVGKTFLFAFLLLLIAPIALYLGSQPSAEKSTAWAYVFFVISFIQILLEFRNEERVSNVAKNK